MDTTLIYIALTIALLPLVGALAAGLFGKQLGRMGSAITANVLVGIAFLLSLYLFKVMVLEAHPAIDYVFYTWATSGMQHFDVAFLLDPLSATMMCVVLFVSLMVHVYTIGYMEDDPGFQRFFSYVSLFTFSMLVLVLSDNFLVMFFGWEGVGLVSYLLIGFWFKREAANLGSLKAFLANRVGDFGFILGIAAVFYYFGTLNYHEVFSQVTMVVPKSLQLFPGYEVGAITLICFLLFIGAMGKSAQVPLHVWLPESMEGPTPISALIHAATMVTAGIYMVARLSPMFEYSPAVLSFILVIGGTTALFMGFLAVTQFDIKRVIAYSTISQLGYMAVALGASAYQVAIFHLVTHAFFKALLFLAAGSVIIALHHEQDMRKMGGLASYLPVTYATFVIGTLALCAIPPFSGFFSKDMIIDAVHLCTTPGASYAYYCVLIGAFVTPVYMFRAMFMTFHGKERLDPKLHGHVQEPAWVVWVPLVMLAIPSVIIGQILIDPMLFAHHPLLGDTIFVLPEHNVFHEIAKEYEGANLMALRAGETIAFWFAMAGIVVAWLFTSGFPQWSEYLKTRFSWIYRILQNKYGFDEFNQYVLVNGTKDVGQLCYEVSDLKVIDATAVGSGRSVRWFASVARHLQTGYLYHYALAMVLGILVFLVWYVGV